MKILLTFLAISTVTLSAGATSPEPSPNTERLFKLKCAPCHGVDGGGGTGASFKGKLAHHTTASISTVIKEGIAGTGMPPNPNLSDSVVHDLALYVQYLNKKK